MTTSSTGPLTVEELRALAAAPHGEAIKRIRKFDPLYGKLSPDGSPVKWKVKVMKDVRATGYVTVSAVTAEDAEAMVDEIDDSKIDWDFEDDSGFWVEEVKAV